MRLTLSLPLIQLAFLIGVLILGTWCVNYDFLHTIHRTIPTFWAFVLNILTGGLSVTVAIVIKVLILLGILK